MQQKLRSLLALTLSALMVFQMMPPRAFAVDEDTANVENVKQVYETDVNAEDWSNDGSNVISNAQNNEETEPEAPAVYEDGVILINNYEQLTKVGSGKELTFGSTVTYASDADYRIAKDITLPEGSVWQLPADFTGSFAASGLSEERSLYDAETDTVYVYHPEQLKAMAAADRNTRAVYDGDLNADTFGTGTPVTDKDGNALTYSDVHHYIISTGFAYTSVKAPVLRAAAKAPAGLLGAAPTELPVTRLVGGEEVLSTYTLIGSAEQLQAINTDENTVRGKYIVFKDIDLSTYEGDWTPIMFMGEMYGIKCDDLDELTAIVSDPLFPANLSMDDRPVISNLTINKSGTLNVNEHEGIGFFGSITNSSNSVLDNLGKSNGTAIVSNIALENVNVVSTVEKAAVNVTLINELLKGLGWVVGELLDGLLWLLSIGSAQTDLGNTIRSLLNARTEDPSVLAVGAFAGRIRGDVLISQCSVSDVNVSNVKDITGGFVGYARGVTEYDGLSTALGITTEGLAWLLNLLPYVGLGDLIDILLVEGVLPLEKIIPVEYIAPRIVNCYVENLHSEIGTDETSYNGGFIGEQIGATVINCNVKDSNYTIKAKMFGGGFAGLERDERIQGLLDSGVGGNLTNIISKFHPQSLIIQSNIENSFYTVSGGDLVGGFVGAQTASYALDCDINCTGNELSVDAEGDCAGGFSGFSSIGWSTSLGYDENEDRSVLVAVKEIANGLLNTDPKASQQLLSIVGGSPSAIMGCSVYCQSIDVSAGDKYAGGLVGKGEGVYVAAADSTAKEEASDWYSLFAPVEATETTEASDPYAPLFEGKTVVVDNLRRVSAKNAYAGGVAGQVSSAAFTGVLNDVVGVADFIKFTVRDVTVNGIEGGYVVTDEFISVETDADSGVTLTTVSHDGYDFGGAIGMATGGQISNVKLNNILRVESYNRAGGFIGLAGPSELVGSNGLTVNLLGLDRLVKIPNLLQVAQALTVEIKDCDVNGIYDADGNGVYNTKGQPEANRFTVEALGRNEEDDAYEFSSGGFIADANSIEISNSHTYNLLYVRSDDNFGFAGGFCGTSETGGLAEAANDDDTAVKALLLEANGLVQAVSYLIPKFTNTTVHFLQEKDSDNKINMNGFVQADVAGGFVADMRCGTVDNSARLLDKYYNTYEDFYAVYNIDKVLGQSYAGGFAGRAASDALASAGGGVSILGNLNVSINITDLLTLVSAYVPKILYAGVNSFEGLTPDQLRCTSHGFTVEATKVSNEPGQQESGSAGGFAGYLSGAQVSYSNVSNLKHTVVTPPKNLEAIEAPSYFDDQSSYAVTGGRYAGGYVGNMNIGSAASLGKGLGVLGNLLSVESILSALSVVVTTIEHSDVTGCPGGFAVLATGDEVLDMTKPEDDGKYGKVGKSGGFAGAVSGGHIQDCDSMNFSYIIGEIAAGGFVGDFRPGDVAKLLDDLGASDKDSALAKALSYVLNSNNLLASLIQAFVPVIYNSTTTCIPCGGAVRAQAPSDKQVIRGMAGGYCGHNEGGQIWGMDNKHNWKEENDGINTLTGEQTDDPGKGHYTGPVSVCYADRIHSVYGYEYSGGFTGYMEPASTAETGNLSLLSGLLSVNNVVSALDATYATEESTAVFGPLRHLDVDTWNLWVEYVGKHGGYGLEFARLDPVTTQEELDSLIEKYRYGTNVVAGRTDDAREEEDFLLTEGGDAGGYVGLMVAGTITYGQAFDTKLVQGMRSVGGFVGKMRTGGAVEEGNLKLLYFVNLDLSNLLKLAEVFVPCIKNSSVEGFQSGLNVVATNTSDNIYVYRCGFAGGYAGTAFGGQIWGDADMEDAPEKGRTRADDQTGLTRQDVDDNLDGYRYYNGCNVENLRYVRGRNSVGGYVGYASSGTVADVNTEASNGMVQQLLDVLISRDPSSTASVLEASMTTIRGASVSAVDDEFGFVIGGLGNGIKDVIKTDEGVLLVDTVFPRYAGGFIGYSEAAVIGSKAEESDKKLQEKMAEEGAVSSATSVEGLRSVDALYYAGGYVGLADVGGVADVASTEDGNGKTTLLQLIQAGNVGVLDAFRSYVYNADVEGVEEGFVVRAHSSEPYNAILFENRIAGCAGGFGGGIMDGSVKNSRVKEMNGVYGPGYCGGFVGHGGKSGVADVDQATVGNDQLVELLSANAGVVDVFGSNIHECTLTGIEKGYDVVSYGSYDNLAGAIAGGFVGLGDESRIVNSHAENLKLVISNQIAGGYAGMTDMAFAVEASVDSQLVRYILMIVNVLVKALYLNKLENVGLIDLEHIDGFEGVAKYLDLKVFAEGDLLYVNLLGLRIGVSLVQDHTGNGEDTAVITIGDSTITLPCSEEGGIDTEGRDAEIVLTLFKANRTKIETSTVTGIKTGYNVYAGGSDYENPATDDFGYAGGFVGQNHEGLITGCEMIYCDIVKGTATAVYNNQKILHVPDDDDDEHSVGHFTGLSQLDTVYGDVNNRDTIEGEGNTYHVYRKVATGTTVVMNEEKGGLPVGTFAPDAGTDYQVMDLINRNPESVVVYADWEGAQYGSGGEIKVYESRDKAVLMEGKDKDRNADIESLVLEPGEVTDPCSAVKRLDIHKVWDDIYNLNGQRPDSIYVKLYYNAIVPGKTSEEDTPLWDDYREYVNEEDGITDRYGYIEMIGERDGRLGSNSWKYTVENLPAYGYEEDPNGSGDPILVYYDYHVVEDAVEGYNTNYKYDSRGTEVKITNSQNNLLPTTGGIGDVMFVIIGFGALLIGSNGLKRREDKNEEKGVI